MALALGLAALAALETALRLLGLADPRLPVNMALPLASRLFIREGEVYRTNPQRRAYFVDQSFPANKPPGALRIFIVGGSAAMGFPMEAAFSPARVIETELHALHPARRFEVINAAGFGQASYRAAAVVKEILDYQPDAVIFMSGNNEFLEWRFDRRDLSPPVRAISRLRLFRALSALVLQARGRGGKVDWEAHDLSAVERQLVIDDFSATIGQVAERCRIKNVRLILATCPANLKDFRPFGASAVSRDEQEAVDAKLQAGDLFNARDHIAKLAARHPADAWVDFEQGWATYRLSPAADPAKRLFAPSLLWSAAKDNDPRPVRALQEINRAVRSASAGEGAWLLDGEAAFWSAGLGAPGDELFFDHCHPNAEGELILGRLLLESLAQAGLIELGPGWEIVSRDALAQHRAGVPDAVWAEAYYRAGYEAGVNMGRVHRGLDLAGKALALDPNHVKARMLADRLRPRAESAVRLTGD